MPLSMGLMDIAKRYRKMANDGSLLSNRRAIDVLDGRVLELLERVDHDEAPERLQTLYALFQDVKANKGRNDAAMYAALSAMDIEFEKVYHDYEAWRQIIEVLDVRRKMVDSEAKIIKDMKAILTAEQAYNLVAKVMMVCIDVVKDPKLLRQINARFARIIGEHDLREPADIVDIEAEAEDEE